eukprot:4042321-Pleurochrysis_carterae.AAC.2
MERASDEVSKGGATFSRAPVQRVRSHDVRAWRDGAAPRPVAIPPLADRARVWGQGSPRAAHGCHSHSRKRPLQLVKCRFQPQYVSCLALQSSEAARASSSVL